MPAPLPETYGRTILIVDDDVPFVRAVAELLTDRGFQVLGHAAQLRQSGAPAPSFPNRS